MFTEDYAPYKLRSLRPRYLKNADGKALHWTASLVLRGQIVAKVLHDPGAESVLSADFMTPAAAEMFQRHAAAVVPKIPSLADCEMSDDPAVLFLLGLAEATEHEDRIRRQIKTTTIFRLRGDQDDSYRRIDVPFGPTIEAGLRDRYGDQVEWIANQRLS